MPRDTEANLAGAIYGTVIVTALVAGLSENDSLSEAEIVVGVVATMLAFWLAHAYGTLVARGTQGGTLPGWREARAALAHEQRLGIFRLLVRAGP